jgi:hypothetical protein
LVSLHLGSNHNVFNDRGFESKPDWIPVDRLAIGPIVVEYTGNVPTDIPLDELESFRVVAAGPRSSFANVTGSFLFNPINQTSAQLVLGPNNASAYAYQGEMFYARTLSPEEWLLPISVGIVGSPMRDPQPCLFDSTSVPFVVPRATLNSVYERIRDLRIDAYVTYYPSPDYPTSIRIRSNISEEILDEFPIIQFAITDDNHNLVSIAQVHPREYVDIYQSRAYIWFESRGEEGCVLTPIVLRKLVLHFDAVNNRVGFGDPLNEF